MTITGVVELTLQVRDLRAREAFSIYLEDPEGNVVEAWDFFDRGDGAERGTDALAEED